jgi:hypothetical protein
MMINFQYTSVPVTAADLEEVENRFGFKFPAELRDHYLQFNGGHPEPDRFVDQKGGAYVVDTFLPIKNAIPGLNTLEGSIQWIKVEQCLLPQHLVQFAVDRGGDYYCFSTREEDFGVICLFRMEYCDNPTRATRHLASSFKSFLAGLTTKEAAQKAKEAAQQRRQ